MRIHILTVTGAFLIGSAALGEDAVTAEDSVQAKSQIMLPADVLVHVGLLRDELEHIRVYMGMPKHNHPPIGVAGAAPREVYFTALTLFSKADRLCFEHTRERAQQPAIPGSEITPGDVYVVVDAALKSVQRVKTRYKIEKSSAAGQRDPEKTPADVLKAIVQENRQLNLMLERRFAPSDVFQQVTLGVGYTSRLLETFPEATGIPDEPAFQPEKRPADVYRRLLGCFQRIREIAERSDVEMLELQVDDAQIEEVVPSDVYDIASLIVAELAHLQAQLPQSKPPRPVYYVGRKFPADVYQRTGILDRQLTELEEWVKRNPNWLKQKQTQ